MYKQTDSIATGSQHGQVLENIFVEYRYCETQLFQNNQKTFLYQRYVDDTFATFPIKGECDEFFAVLNSLHPSLKFTIEKEEDGVLPFLDFKIEKNDGAFLTSLYRKPSFVDRYTRWHSFRPSKRKTTLFST